MSSFDQDALELLVDIKINGIDTSDYPDFCTAYISSASWVNGKKLSNEELEDINDSYPDFVYLTVLNQLL